MFLRLSLIVALVYRDTLEQIDVTTLLIEKYSDASTSTSACLSTPLTYGRTQTFKLATSVLEINEAFRIGKIASLIGVEGYALFLNVGSTVQ